MFNYIQNLLSSAKSRNVKVGTAGTGVAIRARITTQFCHVQFENQPQLLKFEIQINPIVILSNFDWYE